MASSFFGATQPAIAIVDATVMHTAFWNAFPMLPPAMGWLGRPIGVGCFLVRLPESPPMCVAACALAQWPAQKRKSPAKAGLVIGRCRLLLAPARSCQTGEAEAEKGEGAGFRSRGGRRQCHIVEADA